MVKIKILILSVLFSLFSFQALCQIDSVKIKDAEIVFALESWPIYKGGLQALDDMINSNLIYPQSALKNSLKGKVFVQFLVDTCGNTANHIVLKGISEDLDKEALRLAKLIKFDKPAMQGGKPIKVRINIPIEFKLPKKEKQKQ